MKARKPKPAPTGKPVAGAKRRPPAKAQGAEAAPAVPTPPPEPRRPKQTVTITAAKGRPMLTWVAVRVS